MQKILLAGSSGALGMEVAKKLANSFIPFMVLARTKSAAEKLSGYTKDIWVADAQKSDELMGMSEGISHVFSSLGKSVSLFTPSAQDYEKIDYTCNKNIWEEAEKSGVKRFIYSSILGSETGNKLQLARVHYKVRQLLKESSLSYTIIKPTGFFHRTA